MTGMNVVGTAWADWWALHQVTESMRQAGADPRRLVAAEAQERAAEMKYLRMREEVNW